MVAGGDLCAICGLCWWIAAEMREQREMSKMRDAEDNLMRFLVFQPGHTNKKNPAYNF